MASRHLLQLFQQVLLIGLPQTLLSKLALPKRKRRSLTSLLLFYLRPSRLLTGMRFSFIP
jgi:hypothetical protein